jgi:nitrate/nitrite transporter NarK
MRGFHGAWTAFFVAFLGWFAFAPLMTTIRDHVDITKDEIGYAGIASVGTTIFTRFLVGPLIDAYGPRRVMAGLLWYGCIPVALGAFCNSGTYLIVIRGFIGAAGATFVPCQAWTSLMFAPRIVGTANAFSAGWGNLGGGVTQIFMPAVMGLIIAFGVDEKNAWRWAMFVPAAMFFGVGCFVYFKCDDCPQGKYEDLKKQGKPLAAKVVAKDETGEPHVALNYNTWLLFVQYAHCFGVELVVNNVMSMYLYDWFCLDDTLADSFCNIKDNYDLGRDACIAKELSLRTGASCDGASWHKNCMGHETQKPELFGDCTCLLGTGHYLDYTNTTMWIETNQLTGGETWPALYNYERDAECEGERSLSKTWASTIAALFGLANLFARGMGGMTSDTLYRKMGFRGRHWAQMVCLIGISICCMIFSTVRNNVALAVVVLVCFSMFVQAAEGTSYGMVPFLKPSQTGIAAGIVGAGGNAGAVLWSTMFKSIDYWPDVFLYMGYAIAGSALLSFFMEVHGARITPGFSKDDKLDEWRIATGQLDPAQKTGPALVNVGEPPSLSAHSGFTPEAKAKKGGDIPKAELDGSSIAAP